MDTESDVVWTKKSASGRNLSLTGRLFVEGESATQITLHFVDKAEGFLDRGFEEDNPFFWFSSL